MKKPKKEKVKLSKEEKNELKSQKKLEKKENKRNKKNNRDKRDYTVLWVLLGILLVCFISIGFLFYKYFYAGTSESKYGTRLDGIENHKLSETLKEDISGIYKDETSVEKVTVNIEGKIIYITIDFKEAIKVAKAQELAVKSLDKIGEDNLKYYEVQYLLEYTGEEENENFPIFGSKNSNSLKVVW